MNWLKTKKIINRILLAAGLIFLTAISLYADVKVAVIDSGAEGELYQSISFSSVPANIDPIGHGTKIAKLIKDTNPQAQIYMLQVCDKINGRYAPSPISVLKAINWCMENGIDIVNLSLVIDYNKEIEEAIRRAYLNKGIVFVAASENKNIFSQFAVSSDGFVCLKQPNQDLGFPASSDCVISVGAKDKKGKIADYSVTGVDVLESGSYESLHGSSFACARVTAEAAKILALKPAISLTQLKQMLRNN